MVTFYNANDLNKLHYGRRSRAAKDGQWHVGDKLMTPEAAALLSSEPKEPGKNLTKAPQKEDAEPDNDRQGLPGRANDYPPLSEDAAAAALLETYSLAAPANLTVSFYGPELSECDPDKYAGTLESTEGSSTSSKVFEFWHPESKPDNQKQHRHGASQVMFVCECPHVRMRVSQTQCLCGSACSSVG